MSVHLHNLCVCANVKMSGVRFHMLAKVFKLRVYLLLCFLFVFSWCSGIDNGINDGNFSDSNDSDICPVDPDWKVPDSAVEELRKAGIIHGINGETVVLNPDNKGLTGDKTNAGEAPREPEKLSKTN